jgi:DNA helicase-2/ATP-dependent DNA helicase PcrA
MNKEALPYVEAIYRRYQKNLLENNIMDFDDLLILTLEIFDNHPEVTKK